MSRLTDLIAAAEMQAVRDMHEIEDALDNDEQLPRVWWELRSIAQALLRKRMHSAQTDRLRA